MATKREVLDQLARGEGCLGKAGMDEQVFILRGQDMLSPELVEVWADKAEVHGCPARKVEGAREVARLMLVTPNRKYPD